MYLTRAGKRLGASAVIIAILVIVMFLGGCVPVPPAPPAASGTPAAATYNDPFAYCAAVGTIDTPDARYTGAKTPKEVFPIPPGATEPPPFPEGSVYWRCMNGSVYSCVVGANIPCSSKADTRAEPNAGMQSFCKDQPNADFIPAAAAGRDTIYEWSCKDGAPARGKQVFQVDAQGYITQYWQEIPNPPAAPAPAASPVGQ